MSRPATVALLHGCTQGPTGWSEVQEQLRMHGVPAIALDLDPQEFADASGMECAAHLAASLEDADDVVLVGTSCTGIIVPLVAALRPLRALVYVCAGIPDVGRSLNEQIRDDGVLHDDWVNYAGDAVGREAATEFMFNDCDNETLARALPTVRGFRPAKAYDEVFPLPALPDVDSHYWLGTRDRIIRQDWARRSARQRLGVTPVELPTGHCPQNSRPDLVAALLIQRASRGPDW